MSIISFIICIGVLVSIHELGHYLLARLFKVKILTFSIGFGPKLLGFQTKANYWKIGLIPLGGYVQMLDNREAPVLEHEKHLAFNFKPAWQKLLIAAGGPLANIAFAFFCYYGLGLYGINQLKPIIYSINPKYDYNLSLPITINKINQTKIYSWQEAEAIFKKSYQQQINPILNLTTQNNQASQITILINKSATSLEEAGFYPIVFIPKISYIEPNSSAAKAKLKINDQIISINQQKLDWFEMVDLIQNSPSKKINLQILRANQVLSIPLTIDSFTTKNGLIIGKIGIMPSLDLALLQENTQTKKYSILSSFKYAYFNCYNLLSINLSFLSKMIQGEMSWRNLGGPISIASTSSNALKKGIKPFIDFLALLSLSLALLNLLPIPVLDGGHIVIYIIEWIVKKPLSKTQERFIYQLGMYLILTIMALAIYNDIYRLFNQ